MAKGELVARIIDGELLECVLTASLNTRLVLSGNPAEVTPHVAGASRLANSKALVANAWSYAKFKYLSMTLSAKQEQDEAIKRSKSHRSIAIWIAGLAVQRSDVSREAWCSACFQKSDHFRADGFLGGISAHLCGACGSPTVPCLGIGCSNFAVLPRLEPGRVRYCAEHRHDIAGFEKASSSIETIGDYKQLLTYDKKNLKRLTTVASVGLVGLAVGTPAALFAAPAIGGALGTLIAGYTGAAATSHGLAVLGGGALAAGGLGMAGGTLVVTAAGGALGGALGASISNAYVQEDRSFAIDQLRDGPGVPVIVCSGFLTQGGAGWDEWESMVRTRFPDSPVYRVRWGSRELKHFGALARDGGFKAAAGVALSKGAARATKSGAVKMGPLGPVLVLADIAKNPWHVAKDRANKTGVILADLIARSEIESYVLVGHSLGARVAVVAAQALGTKGHAQRLESVHLLGAAIGAKGDWHHLSAAVRDRIYNYHSRTDKVLKWLYTVAQGGQRPAGQIGFVSSSEKLVNVDVTSIVSGHSGYFYDINLKGRDNED